MVGFLFLLKLCNILNLINYRQSAEALSSKIKNISRRHFLDMETETKEVLWVVRVLNSQARTISLEGK